MKLQQIESIDYFRKFLEKYKGFRELPEQYKSTKFCKLYYKMYEYMLSIPKEKIVTGGNLLRYINFFIEAKDFYNWKYRIYSLLTEKLNAGSKRKYELLYRSKAEEKYLKYINKMSTNLAIKYHSKSKEELEQIENKKKATCMKNYGVEHPQQAKEIQEKTKTTIENTYGSGITNISQIESVKKKKEETCLKNYGEKYYFQTKKYKKKHKRNWNSKTNKEKEQILEKQKATMLERYNVACGFQLVSNIHCSGGHSKIADEFCTIIDNTLGNPKDSMYAIKNKEYYIKTNSKSLRFYDYCIPSKKLIVEFQGIYTHGLKKGQEYAYGKPVKEIWKYDEEKKLLAEQNGYKVFYVYEDEYCKDPKYTINKLIKEINNYIGK